MKRWGIVTMLYGLDAVYGVTTGCLFKVRLQQGVRMAYVSRYVVLLLFHLLEQFPRAV